ncbi:MAG: SUMF1/EgtB/PvdO family nonheme iron enzyme [Longimicrobiales bacterium]
MKRAFPYSVVLILFAAVLLVVAASPPAGGDDSTTVTRTAAQTPRNVIFILSDDHRYDFMGFMPAAPGWLDTPNLDRMAAGGAHIRNAFVTTSLCSPSRASILTGRYAHRHGIVDNTSPIPAGTQFFPQFLHDAGFRTAYVGKWHMGEVDDVPQPGFDHWVSFRGQGVYQDPLLNIDGERRQVQGYTTDVLTDQALAWLEQTRREAPDQPFFLYLSHKAVHAEFEPAPRHTGRYANEPIPYPETMANTEANYRGKPAWVEAQRYGWHGVDYMYQGAMEFDPFYRSYTETLLALDESVGRVLDWLETNNLDRSTLVVYMGDNGFLLGEHGLIDKRQAYEESIRVPMIAWAPGFIEPGSVIEPMVRNIDIAPTLLDLAGVESPVSMDGRSVLPLLRGEPATWPLELLYEYYWEYAFPHTPTVFALRDSRFKFIDYHGIWDLNELYDLEADPKEQHNLITVPAYAERVNTMRTRLWDLLEQTGGLNIPLKRPGSFQAGERKRSGDAPPGMVYIPGGRTRIGSDDGLPDEMPSFEVDVEPFLLDAHPVTVEAFSAFVDATSYVTDAERFRAAGVYDPSTGGWQLVAGANWQRPLGPHAPPAPPDHPVTQISWNDAMAYARWAGKRLPTEVEWEHAARGASNDRSPYAWGDSLVMGGRYQANTWQGSLPSGNTADDGHLGTSPAGAYGTTALGLADMGGNVWEWTADWFRSYAERGRPFQQNARSEKVTRGGSFLCNPDYCHGYRVSARSHSSPETALYHTGFRLARDAEPADTRNRQAVRSR